MVSIITTKPSATRSSMLATSDIRDYRPRVEALVADLSSDATKALVRDLARIGIEAKSADIVTTATRETLAEPALEFRADNSVQRTPGSVRVTVTAIYNPASTW